MDKQILLDQIDFVQARIEELDKQIINSSPSDKGYTGLIDSYNKWIDRYNIMLGQLEDLENEGKLSKKELIDIIFRSAELGVKILVPVTGLVATVAVAKLAYANDLDLKLCNGRIFGNTKDLIRLATMKI